MSNPKAHPGASASGYAVESYCCIKPSPFFLDLLHFRHKVNFQLFTLFSQLVYIVIPGDTIMKFKLNLIPVMLFLTILPGGLYGGSKDLPVASTNNAEPQKDIVSTDISSLMDSMNIQRLPKPESSPDFNLMSVAEEQFRLSEQRGRVVLLSFWATW